MTEEEDYPGVRSSMLFFAELITAEDIPEECKQKREVGCFPSGLECPDSETCPESSK